MYIYIFINVCDLSYSYESKNAEEKRRECNQVLIKEESVIEIDPPKIKECKKGFKNRDVQNG